MSKLSEYIEKINAIMWTGYMVRGTVAEEEADAIMAILEEWASDE
jgi:hypothetical protein